MGGEYHFGEGEMKFWLTLAFCFIILCSMIAVDGAHVRYPFSDSSIKPKLSPSNHISGKEVHVYSDRAVLYQKGLIWARVKNTHSMEPTLNSNSITLEKKPDLISQIKEGDIISYSHESLVIIHRVVKIGSDEKGWFVITKGDNNEVNDSYKVRFTDIKGIVVGIIY